MAREADGSVRDALSLLDQVLSLGRDSLSHQEVVELLGLVDRELVRATARAVLEGDAARVLELVEQVYAAGGEMQAFYAALQEHFRNLAAALAAPEGAALFGLEAEELAELRREAARFSPESLHEVFDHLARSEELFRRAAQPRLVMEMTLLKLTQLKPVLSLEDILARLGGGDGGEDEREPEEPSQGPAPRPAPRQDSAAGPAAARALAEMAGREGYPRLASYLGQAEVSREEGHLVVRLPATPLAQDLVTEENQRRLEEMARQLWPEVEGLRLEAAPAPEEEPSAPPADQEAQRAAELADHPAVREAVEVFEAQVVALNPTPPQR
jgi:DNA polymerase-3 subunit gamma/tau